MQTEEVLVQIFPATIFKLFMGPHLDYCNVIFDKAINHVFHSKLDGL